MPLTGRSAEQIAALEAQLLNSVPADGTSIGNIRLRDDVLRWNGDLYLAVRARLLDRGELISGRGKGGSVRRPVVAAAPEPHAVQQGELAGEGGQVVHQDPYADEAALYDPITTVVIREEAVRTNPDPARLNAFIRNQLSEGTRDQIVRWFR